MMALRGKCLKWLREAKAIAETVPSIDEAIAGANGVGAGTVPAAAGGKKPPPKATALSTADDAKSGITPRAPDSALKPPDARKERLDEDKADILFSFVDLLASGAANGVSLKANVVHEYLPTAPKLDSEWISFIAKVLQPSSGAQSMNHPEIHRWFYKLSTKILELQLEELESA
jgi:hypothetical protein